MLVSMDGAGRVFGCVPACMCVCVYILGAVVVDFWLLFSHAEIACHASLVQEPIGLVFANCLAFSQTNRMAAIEDECQNALKITI